MGSLAGVYTASMPVFEVVDRATGIKGFCNFYEGTNPRRLNYGVCTAPGSRSLRPRLPA